MVGSATFRRTKVCSNLENYSAQLIHLGWVPYTFKTRECVGRLAHDASSSSENTDRLELVLIPLSHAGVDLRLRINLWQVGVAELSVDRWQV